jgi:hypothetical protein
VLHNRIDISNDSRTCAYGLGLGYVDYFEHRSLPPTQLSERQELKKAELRRLEIMVVQMNNVTKTEPGHY